MRNQRGVVYLETLIGFMPVFLLFLGTIHVADASVANLVVSHAANAAARAAVVVLPDDGIYYDDPDNTDLHAFTGYRRTDIERAADTILAGNGRIDSSGSNVALNRESYAPASLDGSASERELLIARVSVPYRCIIPVFCPGGLNMQAESQLIYQGASYVYEASFGFAASSIERRVGDRLDGPGAVTPGGATQGPQEPGGRPPPREPAEGTTPPGAGDPGENVADNGGGQNPGVGNQNPSGGSQTPGGGNQNGTGNQNSENDDGQVANGGGRPPGGSNQTPGGSNENGTGNQNNGNQNSGNDDGQVANGGRRPPGGNSQTPGGSNENGTGNQNNGNQSAGNDDVQVANGGRRPPGGSNQTPGGSNQGNGQVASNSGDQNQNDSTNRPPSGAVPAANGGNSILPSSGGAANGNNGRHPSGNNRAPGSNRNPASDDGRLADASNSRPTGNDGRPSGNDSRPNHSDGRPKSNDGRHSSNDGRLADGSGNRPTGSDGRPTGSDRPPNSNDGRHSSNDGRLADGSGSLPTGSDGRPTGSDGRPPGSDGRANSNDGRHSSNEGRLADGNGDRSNNNDGRHSSNDGRLADGNGDRSNNNDGRLASATDGRPTSHDAPNNVDGRPTGGDNRQNDSDGRPADRSDGNRADGERSNTSTAGNRNDDNERGLFARAVDAVKTALGLGRNEQRDGARNTGSDNETAASSGSSDPTRDVAPGSQRNQRDNDLATGADPRSGQDQNQNDPATGLPRDLRDIPVVRDPSLEGSTVRVHYTHDDSGRITGIEVRVGPDAEARHVADHAATVRTMQGYQGLAGRARILAGRIKAWFTNNPQARPGSMAWEARREVEKLRAIIDARARVLDSGELGDAEHEIFERERKSYEKQLAYYEAVVADITNEPGRGYVAADDSDDQVDEQQSDPHRQRPNVDDDWAKYEPLNLLDERTFRDKYKAGLYYDFKGHWRAFDSDGRPIVPVDPPDHVDVVSERDLRRDNQTSGVLNISQEAANRRDQALDDMNAVFDGAEIDDQHNVVPVKPTKPGQKPRPTRAALLARMGALVTKKKSGSPRLTAAEEAELKKLYAITGRMGEVLGERAAAAVMYAQGAEKLWEEKGNGVFDQVWRVPGGGLVIVEAKGPSGGSTSYRIIDGERVEQGTKEYALDVANEMTAKATRAAANGDPDAQAQLDLAMELFRAIDEGKLNYIKVQAPAGKGQGITIWEFDLG